MIRVLALATALLASNAQAQAPLPPAPPAEAKKLREAFAAALLEPGEKGKALALGRSLEAKFSRESLLAALADGPPAAKGPPKPRRVDRKEEKLSVFGTTTVGYAFEFDGKAFRYAVDVPPRLDGTKRHGVLVDPGHGGGANVDDKGKADYVPFWRNQLERAGLGDWLVVRTEIVEQIGTGGKMGGKPEDEGAAVFEAFRRDLLARFPVDPDRVYVSGLSQTGFWSWYLGREIGDRLAGIAPMGAVTWEVDGALENFANLPVFVIHGERDPTCAVAQPRATTKRMEEMGLPVRYLEVPGEGHDGKVWGRLPEALDWLKKQPRQVHPRRVVRRLGTTRSPWCAWVRVEELEREGTGEAETPPHARIEASVEGQVVKVASEGVKRLTAFLPAALLDLDKEVEVVWNGKSAGRKKPDRSFVTALEAAIDRGDWKTLLEAKVSLP
jgi:pimeloyl-ACP methyl ester carboxylesterase